MKEIDLKKCFLLIIVYIYYISLLPIKHLSEQLKELQNNGKSETVQCYAVKSGVFANRKRENIDFSFSVSESMRTGKYR
jgi:hypothetical protein